MPLRLVDAYGTPEHGFDFLEATRELDVEHVRVEPLRAGSVGVRVLAEAERVEDVLNVMEDAFRGDPGYTVTVLPVEAFLPRNKALENAESGPRESRPQRLSRDEIYENVTEAVKSPPAFLALTVLSSVVAAVGLYRDDVAVIVGAMVIAPLLAPSVALALAITLADGPLARRALGVNAAAVAAAFVVAFLAGAVFPVIEPGARLAARARVGIPDVALALAAGAAAVLSFTSGVPSALVGVMVAVALVPPLVAAGLLLGSGHVGDAAYAAMLLAINLVGIQFAAVAAFAAQGVRPRFLPENKWVRWGLGLLVVALVALTLAAALPDRP